MSNFEGLNVHSVNHLKFMESYAHENLLPETREWILEALDTLQDAIYSVKMRTEAAGVIQQAFDLMQVDALIEFLEKEKETLQYTFGDVEGLLQFKAEYGIEDPEEVVE